METIVSALIAGGLALIGTVFTVNSGQKKTEQKYTQERTGKTTQITVRHNRCKKYTQYIYCNNICISKMKFLKQQPNQCTYCKYENR